MLLNRPTPALEGRATRIHVLCDGQVAGGGLAPAREQFATVIPAWFTADTRQRLAPMVGPASKGSAVPARVDAIQDGATHSTQVLIATEVEAADWLTATEGPGWMAGRPPAGCGAVVTHTENAWTARTASRETATSVSERLRRVAMKASPSRGGPPSRGPVALALRYYGRELARLRWLTAPAMLMPALGNIGINYIAPLVVAKLVGRIAGGAGLGLDTCLPYVLAFAGVLLLSEAAWRLGLHCLNRLDALGIERLYIVGMDELFAKDAAFFHDNFAGSLTKRVLSFASRFEEFVDALTFSVVGRFVPLLFGSVVLWRYEPLLVVVLLAMIAVTGVCVLPLIRRRQALVARREEAIARVSGHVSDSLMNMDTVRAFAAEEREAAEHRSRVAQSRALTLRSWDYGNLRIDTLVAPMSVVTNALGLLIAVTIAGSSGGGGGVGGSGHGVEAVVVAFTYFSNATRIMFEFNWIGRPYDPIAGLRGRRVKGLGAARPTAAGPLRMWRLSCPQLPHEVWGMAC